MSEVNEKRQKALEWAQGLVDAVNNDPQRESADH